MRMGERRRKLRSRGGTGMGESYMGKIHRISRFSSDIGLVWLDPACKRCVVACSRFQGGDWLSFVGASLANGVLSSSDEATWEVSGHVEIQRMRWQQWRVLTKKSVEESRQRTSIRVIREKRRKKEKEKGKEKLKEFGIQRSKVKEWSRRDGREPGKGRSKPRSKSGRWYGQRRIKVQQPKKKPDRGPRGRRRTQRPPWTTRTVQKTRAPGEPGAGGLCWWWGTGRYPTVRRPSVGGLVR